MRRKFPLPYATTARAPCNLSYRKHALYFGYRKGLDFQKDIHGIFAARAINDAVFLAKMTRQGTRKIDGNRHLVIRYPCN